jgi:hypothetical protein
MNLETLTVALEGDASKYNKTLDDSERKARGWSSGMSSILTGAAMGLGLGLFNMATKASGALVGFMGSTIGAASDLSETISKTNVLFDESASQILAWSETSATAFGQSQQQALDAAANFAIFGKAAGLSGQELVSFSTDFVELASDLASFNNTSPEQAINAIGAALRGESEPLRQYGVLLDDASMRQKALELGLISTTKNALTPQQKVLAAQALIYEQTSAAQGDFARTSDGLANSTRSLSAVWENFRTELGESLLPIAERVMGWVSGLAETWLPRVASAVGGFVTGLDALIRYLGGVISNGDTLNEWLTHLPDAVQPAVQAIGEAINKVVEFYNAAKEKIDQWGQDFSNWYDTYGRPFVVKFGDMFTELDIEARVNAILAQLGRISAWFRMDGEGGEPLRWAIRFGSAFTALVDASTIQIERLLGGIELMGRAFEALQAGRWRDAWNLGVLGSEMLGGLGINDFIQDFRRSYNAATSALDSSLYTGPTSGRVGGAQSDPYGYRYGGNGITVNLYMSGGDYASGRAAGRGVADALRAQGVAP